MIIGITGCIGSGKSLLSHHLSSLGYLTFDCDVITKEAYQNKAVLEKLKTTFNCFTNQQFDKEKLKRQLDDKGITKLNQIIHPYVINRIKELKNRHFKEMVFIEIPLLFELSLEEICDFSIAIDVDDELREERLKVRDPDNYQLMRNLEQKQWSNEEKCSKADFVLHNIKDKDYLFEQVEKLLIILINSDKI